LIVLALLSPDDLADRLSIVYSVLDVEGESAMDEAQVALAMDTLLEVVVFLTYLATSPDEKTKQVLVANLLEYRDSNGKLARKGFVDWGRKETKGGGLFSELVHSATSGSSSGAPVALSKYRKKVTLDASHSKEAHRRATRKYGSGIAQIEHSFFQTAFFFFSSIYKGSSSSSSSSRLVEGGRLEVVDFDDSKNKSLSTQYDIYVFKEKMTVFSEEEKKTLKK
jgi:hypothetical protein